MNAFVDYLAARGMAPVPGLDDAALGDLEATLDARLPEPVRELYRRCGGFPDAVWGSVPDLWTHMPMRLMPPDEVEETAAILSESEDVYEPSPEARYLFTDDGSNWAGVFVEGPLFGKVTILDHDEPSMAPRFRDLPSFLDKLMDAGRRCVDWNQMLTDYPMSPDGDQSLAEEAGPLSRLYMDRYRRVATVPAALALAETALYLLPPADWQVLQECLHSEHQYVRYVALVVAETHKPRPLIPELSAYAQAMQQQNNFTHWLQACRALRATNAQAEVEILQAAADPNWL